MACNKLLLVGLLFAGFVTASWAVVFLLPLCPTPASDGSSATGLAPRPSSDPAAGSTDAESFCVPDWDYLPHGSFYYLVGGFLGWICCHA